MKNQKRSKSSIIHLPEEVVMEIFKWLPLKDLLKCCRVCRRWRDLISTQHFKEMHLKSSCRTPPMVLVSIVATKRWFCSKRSKFLLLQNIWDTKRKRLTIGKLDKKLFPSSPLIFRYDGLIVFYDDNYTSYGNFIFNPISGKKLPISRPVGLGFAIFGMFFSTLIKEYCVLWGSFEKGSVQIKMLILGVEQSFVDLKPPRLLINKPKFPPVVIDSILYWLLRHHDGDNHVSCEEVIMAFDTKGEEFSLMPHPGSTKSCAKFGHTNMHIVKICNCLSFVRLKCEESFLVNIWTLKDSTNRLWVKTYRVSFDNWDGLTLNHIQFHLPDIEVMAFENGELLLLVWSGRKGGRLYAFNLNYDTVRKIGSAYFYADRFCMYMPSLASPMNGQSTQI